MIDRRAPWLRSGPRRKIAANSPFADLIRRHLLQLAGSGLALSEAEATVLTDDLCNLLALATARDIEDARPPAARTHGWMRCWPITFSS